MLHLQTSNQSPVTLQLGIFPSVAAIAVSVVVVVVAAAISYKFNNSGGILALNFLAPLLRNYLFLMCAVHIMYSCKHEGQSRFIVFYSTIDTCAKKYLTNHLI
jgi:hypothetical protein